MNVLFLDMDGVINGTEFEKQYFREYGLRLRCFGCVCPVMVHRVNKLIEEFDLKIVWSSDWRLYGRNFEEKRKILKDTGILAENLIGITPSDDFFCERREEIEYYLRNHPAITFSIILDDREDAEVKDYDNCFYIRTTMKHGFTRELYEKARNICIKNIR